MSEAAVLHGGRTLTRAGLHRHVRALHRPRIEWMNPGWMCIAAGLLLSAIGIAIMSALPAGEREADHSMRQTAFLCLAFIAAAVAMAPHYRWLQRFSMPLLFFVLLLLVVVLVPWMPDSIVRARKGAHRWINVGVTEFQPSELAKVAYVVALASYLRLQSNYRRFLGLFRPFLLTFVPMLLILAEPDLGTSLLFLPTLFAMLVAAGAKLRHLLIIVVLGLAAAPAMYPMLRPHQKDRIDALYYQLLGDPRHVQDIGYQGQTAMMLSGAGGVFGVGERKAFDLVQHNHLPEKQNDMIFAVILCRWGAMGAFIVWSLYALCCLGALAISARCRDPFGRLVAVGIAAMLFSQMTINTGMTIGLLPITGMTLPFVSAGGSSLVTTWLMVGLLFNIAMRRPQYLARASFEFAENEVKE